MVVRGNHDDFIAGDIDIPFIQWHRERLGPERLDYLRNLPGTHNFRFSGRKIRLFHASQVGVHHRVHMNAPEEEHQSMFTNTYFTGDGFEPDTIGYGDIHQVYYKNRFGKVLFNAGSVGNALDEPLAAYVIMEGTYDAMESGYFSVRIIRLPYDIEMAIRQAMEEDMPQVQEWEDELRTGRYRRDSASRLWRQADAESDTDYTRPSTA